MTTAAEPRVVSAECWACGVYLEQEAGTDIAAGLRAFRAHHPLTTEAPHLRRIPAGWRVPLSGPGALSQ